MYEELIKRLQLAAERKTIHDQTRIDCRAAADAIEELSHEYEKLAEDFNGAVELLHKREKPRWIPVTERLPEVGVWVLCYCRANSFDVFRMTDEGHWQYGNRSIYMKGYVTHWMPLPPAPEEE